MARIKISPVCASACARVRPRPSFMMMRFAVSTGKTKTIPSIEHSSHRIGTLPLMIKRVSIITNGALNAVSF